jgi:wyosine [tRNA(Phe)-imidazoG37] synthetase (radical SAM superfamily)
MDRFSIEKKYVFGPVPSRRSGRSLRVDDLVPYKTCTFDCIYCDLGRTTYKTTSRQSYASPEEIQRELELTLSISDTRRNYTRKPWSIEEGNLFITRECP